MSEIVLQESESMFMGLKKVKGHSINNEDHADMKCFATLDKVQTYTF